MSQTEVVLALVAGGFLTFAVGMLVLAGRRPKGDQRGHVWLESRTSLVDPVCVRCFRPMSEVGPFECRPWGHRHSNS